MAVTPLRPRSQRSVVASAAADGQTGRAPEAEVAPGEGAAEVAEDADGGVVGAEVVTDPADDPQPTSAATAAIMIAARTSPLRKRLMASLILARV
jgi:hypothetical protein